MIWKFTACLRGHSVWPDRNPLSMAFRNRGVSPCCSFVYPFVHASNISLSKTILLFRVIVYGLLAGQRGGGKVQRSSYWLKKCDLLSTFSYNVPLFSAGSWSDTRRKIKYSISECVKRGAPSVPLICLRCFQTTPCFLLWAWLKSFFKKRIIEKIDWLPCFLCYIKMRMKKQVRTNKTTFQNASPWKLKRKPFVAVHHCSQAESKFSEQCFAY